MEETPGQHRPTHTRLSFGGEGRREAASTVNAVSGIRLRCATSRRLEERAVRELLDEREGDDADHGGAPVGHLRVGLEHGEVRGIGPGIH